jgi:anti-sigma factor RsiW
MRCEAFAASLTAYGLGELPAAEAAAAREHLATCDRCGALVLRDRELVGRLRAAASPAPASVHHAVRRALRRERLLRRRHLLRVGLGGAAAAALLGVVTVAPDQAARPLPAPVAAAPDHHGEYGGGPLAAAWTAYQAPELPLERYGDGDPLLLGFTPVQPDLAPAGLRPSVSGTLHLAGRPAFAAEFTSAAGDRLTLFRWQGRLPESSGDYPGGGRPELRIVRSGLTSSAWWEDGDVVWCLVGDLEHQVFEQALARIRHTT